jgi:DNA adenine methylase
VANFRNEKQLGYLQGVLMSGKETGGFSSLLSKDEHGWYLPMHPFLKWAGGKRWLVRNYSHLLPKEINGRYIEPFLGSGSVYFHLRPKDAILADINKDLIDTYKGVKNHHIKLNQYLIEHHKNHSIEHYYKVRSNVPEKLAERAARFIYLNRTCFNGIYRVNASGGFNVPIGTHSNVILSTDCFHAWSQVLKGTSLVHGDFEKVINLAEKGDFLFVDPPYTVRHNFNGFIHYNEVLFSWDDQVRLSKAIRRAKQRGAKILMTNANHESIRKLYSADFQQKVVSRFSSISASAEGRSAYEELLITT